MALAAQRALIATFGLWTAMAALGAGGRSGPVPQVPYCSGEYADDFAALSSHARELEQTLPQYTYCVRNTATYECLSYGSDGNVHRARKKAVSHGTAFGFRQQGGETFLLTNQHVAEWPIVTSEDHPVEDVPAGCKRVSQTLRIVDNESDAYERDDIALSHVMSDAQLDVGVLKAHAALPILPWKIGKSAALKERNVVDVRGFPLGAFKATNVGKVVSAQDHDDFKDWDHDDFVIDALLSPGNSGSPVFAISCKTGEFELVGIYHANYTGGSALNVVVSVDQFKEVFTGSKYSPRLRAEGPMPFNAEARQQLIRQIASEQVPFFPLGPLPASARTRPDGAIVFEVFSRDFPLKTHPIAVLEDLPPTKPDSFGELGRAWFGSLQGLKLYGRTDLDPETQVHLSRLLEGLRKNAQVAFAYRSATSAPAISREDFQKISRLERTLQKVTAARADSSQVALDLSDRLGPHGAEPIAALAEAFSPPPKPPLTGVGPSPAKLFPSLSIPSAIEAALPSSDGEQR